MDKLDQFVKAMELAFSLSRELGLCGIDRIEWDLTYSGATKATQKIKHEIEEAMKRAGLTVNEEVA